MPKYDKIRKDSCLCGGCPGHPLPQLHGLMQFHRNFDLAVSQADHPEIFEGIRSETEGIRLVKETARHFLKEGKPWILVELVWKSGWKFLGYRLGKQYRRLPDG